MDTEEKTARLIAIQRGKEPRGFVLGEETVLLGRMTGDEEDDDQKRILISSKLISRKHGEFTGTDGAWFYRDLGSSNGTWIDGAHYGKNAKSGTRRLSNGDVLRIAREGDTPDPEAVLLLFVSSWDDETRWNTLPLRQQYERLDIGRGEGMDLTLNDPAISRYHASFVRDGDNWVVEDPGSANGVWVNQKRINESAVLTAGDVIRIANTFFVFLGDVLLHTVAVQSRVIPEPPTGSPTSRVTAPPPVPAPPTAQRAVPPRPAPQPQPVRPVPQRPGVPPQAARPAVPMQRQMPPPAAQPPRAPVQRWQTPMPVRQMPAGRAALPPLQIMIAERSVWHMFKKTTILKDIRINIGQSELVMVLGGSGAGKTTFLNAVMGYEKADGEIRRGDIDIYRDYEKIRHEIGYVPQQDLLRLKDNVYDTLLNAAEMRMPEWATIEMREQRTEQVLAQMGLERERESLVEKLSGGQRKRLSIAVELISDPNLFFLDEPDSGLDGIMARSLHATLRQIANQGKIVIVITHSPDRVIELYDKVIVLAKSVRDNTGRLAFYGSPSQARAFFSADSMENIVRRINRTDEGGEGLADVFIDRYAQTGGR